MVDALSPLGPAYRPGRHGSRRGEPGVTLSETQPGSIVQLAAWHDTTETLLGGLRDVTGLALAATPGAGVAGATEAAFNIAPGKVLVVADEEGLSAKLSAAILLGVGTVTDLSHGRTAIRVAGPRAEWVLSKLFAVDFSAAAFPVGSGLSTVHHDVFAQVQRTGPDRFDLYVFRSFARAFWRTLEHACEEVGYEVV